MLPIKDDVPSRTVPFVNYAMIAACALVFFAQLQQGDILVEQFGMVPQRITQPDGPPIVTQRLERVVVPGGYGIVTRQHQMAPAAVQPPLTVLTCIFLHGGWMHFLGNMWFLYIFGDNVEDRFGHLGYLLLYVVCGAAASLAHLISSPMSAAPTIGASGAIAGVMGAYLVLYPRAKVLAIFPIIVIAQAMILPAYVFLGFWFAIQLFQSVGSITAESGGVAWWAHTGGFAIGAVVTLLLKTALRDQSPLRSPVTETRDYQAGAYRPHQLHVRSDRTRDRWSGE